MKKTWRSQKGFTLIELLIVVAVLGALVAVVVPAVGSFLTTAKIAAANIETANVKTAAMSYLTDNGEFPQKDGGWDSVLLSPTYLSDVTQYGDYEFDSDSGQIEKAAAKGDYGGIMHFVKGTQSWDKGEETSPPSPD